MTTYIKLTSDRYQGEWVEKNEQTEEAMYQLFVSLGKLSDQEISVQEKVERDVTGEFFQKQVEREEPVFIARGCGGGENNIRNHMICTTFQNDGVLKLNLDTDI